MALPNYVYAGAVDPEALIVDVTPSESFPDLRLVTSATLVIKKPDNTSATWTTALSLKTASTLRLTHVFASLDVTLTGIYKVTPLLYTASWMRRAEPTTFLVKPI